MKRNTYKIGMYSLFLYWIFAFNQMWVCVCVGLMHVEITMRAIPYIRLYEYVLRFILYKFSHIVHYYYCNWVKLFSRRLMISALIIWGIMIGLFDGNVYCADMWSVHNLISFSSFSCIKIIYIVLYRFALCGISIS